MKVYALERHVPYEFDELRGIYDSLDSAASTMREKEIYDCEQWTITEYELNSKWTRVWEIKDGKPVLINTFENYEETGKTLQKVSLAERKRDGKKNKV